MIKRGGLREQGWVEGAREMGEDAIDVMKQDGWGKEARGAGSRSKRDWLSEKGIG